MYNTRYKGWFDAIMENNPIVLAPYRCVDMTHQEVYKNNPSTQDRPNNHPLGDSQGDMMLLTSWYYAGQNCSLYK